MRRGWWGRWWRREGRGGGGWVGGWWGLVGLVGEVGEVSWSVVESAEDEDSVRMSGSSSNGCCVEGGSGLVCLLTGLGFLPRRLVPSYSIYIHTDTTHQLLGLLSASTDAA